VAATSQPHASLFRRTQTRAEEAPLHGLTLFGLLQFKKTAIKQFRNDCDCLFRIGTFRREAHFGSTFRTERQKRQDALAVDPMPVLVQRNDGMMPTRFTDQQISGTSVQALGIAHDHGTGNYGGTHSGGIADTKTELQTETNSKNIANGKTA
jgi:hypothetical protein